MTAPFADFVDEVRGQAALRAAVTAHTRTNEASCVRALLGEATLSAGDRGRSEATARRLVGALRSKGTSGAVQQLVREYDLSSQEGVALMCLAEALLRIPDAATRDALIRDQIGPGDWRALLGHGGSLFVNAATWGLVVTGRLVSPVDEGGLSSALGRLIARGGEPVIRKGVDMAMRMMGEQFVAGQTIEEALRHARRLEAKGFRYSYDMLGEAAVTQADANRYHGDYEAAIHAIGRAAAGAGPYEGPGISVKLSALHPRYSRSQRGRVMAELLPRLAGLAALARSYDIGFNIDAEESERLEVSLDLIEALCLDPALAGWNGLGFVVQAYQKRAPYVIDFLIDLGVRTGHRLMVRLVKGAYWDSEIKRAQQDGLDDFPVFTRKAHTDVSYMACARRLLAAPLAVFPQFATHNAYSVAAIHAVAGDDFRPGLYEFQCLHGMGEPLYDEVVGHNRLNRPARIYAPVGTHETLLAYLVRRLLENGANSSFVNRIQDPAISIDDLVEDPAAQVAATHPVGAPHERIRLPRDLFAPGRANARGMDLSNEDVLQALAGPLSVVGPVQPGEPIRNPADRGDVVGHVMVPGPAEVEAALASAAASAWGRTPALERAAILRRGADAMEAAMPDLLGLLVREAGKTLANAVGEVREAVDFMRYYAGQVADGFGDGTHVPLGPVACISPWNFPLAIFTGQVAAALAAGNAVLAKPAEETPLIAGRAVALLHAAGVPGDALHFLPGAGAVGAALVADARVCGVVFTGSTEVARLIQLQLAGRLSAGGRPVPLVAETGGQNALVVDSSALAEQVVADVLLSAFDSAGQRCSALRVLCLQEEIADRTLGMLKGALAELAVGNPDRLETDIGPVISGEARDGILAHIGRMRAAGHAVFQGALGSGCEGGTFVAPAIIEIGGLSDLGREVFGPVLHVLRFRRDGLDALLDAIDATGYGLTFGLHTRIGDVAERVVGRAGAGAGAGNIYVNRNIVGAVVGVQPFGGHGLSGTGPKAGGPLYLRRLLARAPVDTGLPAGGVPAAYRAWCAWTGEAGLPSLAGIDLVLPGPVGEENRYMTRARGRVLCVAGSEASLRAQIAAALATGNRAVVRGAVPPALAPWVDGGDGPIAAALFDGPSDALLALARELAGRDGPIIPIHVAVDGRYALEWLVLERCVSTNTTAAGGNANLMMLG